ncbi:unnamed protein product [Chilo suppressalis]|uniref:RNA-directed RNA polymerase n=1 Tax=Chilo suppressalis TaxID=168631 RepID=A0ABN8B0R1_CHISP|nr:unnamed protein product [Chilo suppressalis]
MLRYTGRKAGFAQRTQAEVSSTPFLPEVDTGKWRSPVTQSAIKHDIQKFSNLTKEPDCPFLRAAIAKTYNAFRLPQPVKMIHLNDVFQQDLDIWDKSPGLPWKEQGYKTKNDIRKDPEAVRRVRYFAHKIKNGIQMSPPDCMANVRSHVCPRDERKIRAIWGYPATITFIEGMFALPLIRAYQEKQNPIAYGYETAIGGARRVCRRFANGRKFAALDFSGFDKTVPAWLIKYAFMILQSNIDFVNYEDHGVADAERMIRLWNYLVRYFIYTPIRTADGHCFRKSSGVASGSYFTQLIDSVCNHILCEWICLTQDVELKDLLVMGDDSILNVGVSFSLREACALVETIGMKINLSKSQVTDELYTLKFLGYSLGGGCPFKQHDDWC